MADRKFMAGAATSNISPRLGVSMNGGMQDRLAEHIHDELHARVIVLDDGQSRLALVVCDSCALPGDVIQAAKHIAHGHTGLTMDRILVSATHTHSAPTAVSVFQSEPDQEYAEFLVMRIADGIRRAINQLAPAKIGWCVAQEPTEVFNRRWKMKPGGIPADPFGRQTDQVQMNPPRGSAELDEPAGPIDPDVTLLSLQHADGRPLAVLANYSLHYVGDTLPNDVSGDYFAAFADSMQQLLKADRLDPPFVGMMFNGTSGNINNIDFRATPEPQPPYTRIRGVARRVAEKAHEALKTVEYHDWAGLDMREARLKLGRRLPAPDEVDRAKFVLSQVKGNGPLTTAEQLYARETLLLSEMSKELETVVQALRIGDLGIAAIPCETFVETGLAIKESSPLKPTMTISLANDYAGYLPTVEHHALGGYETWRARSSFLEVEAEPRIRGKVLELLGELA